MSNLSTQTESSLSPETPSRFSMATKLVQAAALAATLVPLSTVEADAAPLTITCGFGGAEAGDGTVCDVPLFSGVGGEGGFYSAFFDWGPYSLTLEFFDVRGPFVIGVTNNEITQDAMADSGRLADNFPNDICVPIADGTTTCVSFRFSGDIIPTDDTWRGMWQATINWDADTNAGYPGATVRVRHARGDDCAGPDDGCEPNGPDDFDTDITIPDSYCPEDCFDEEVERAFRKFQRWLGIDRPTDPEIASTDDNFQDIMVTSQQVIPEPATLALLGAGLGSLAYRRRSKRSA
jgi:hypothetical protein